jgi:hypothetical protein
VPRHVAQLVPRLFAPLVVDYSASRRLVVDYLASAARLGASARCAARHAARRAARRRLLRLRRASGCLGTSRGSSLVVDYSASRRLVVDDFAYAARPGASARRAAHRSSSTTPPRAGLSSTTSSSPRVRVPQHVARLVTRLVAPLVVDYSASRRLVVDYSASPRLAVDYSVRRDFVLQPRWLYFIHAVRRDYLSRDNIGCTSSMPRAATTSSSGRIASIIHLD